MKAQRVAEAIAYYEDLLETRHMQSTRDLMSSAIRRQAIPDGDSRLCTAMRPYFVTEPTYQHVMRIAQHVNGAVRKVADALAQDRKLRRSIAIPEHVDRILEIDREKGAFSVTSRLDSFLSPSGGTQFIESNSDPLLSVGEVDLAFEAMPIARDFARAFPFRSHRLYDLALDALHLDHGRDSRPGVPTIGLIRTDTPSISQGSFYRWLAYAAARGCNVLLAKPEEFEYGGRRLSADGVVVDWVAMSTAWDYLLDPPQSMQAVLQAIKDGAVRVLNGLSRALLSSYKNIFEVLSNRHYSSLFNSTVSGVLREHIPWTRVVRDCMTEYRGHSVDLLSFIADNQAELVLKPSGGHGGAGVVLGWKCTPEVWNATLRRAQVQSYVVQERVKDVDVSAYPVLEGDNMSVEELSADFNPFVWNGTRAEGCLVRLSRADLHNLAAGGSIAALWILEDIKS